jgi:hypothetical protein
MREFVRVRHVNPFLFGDDANESLTRTEAR